MFNLLFHFTRKGFDWKRLKRETETGKTSKAEKAGKRDAVGRRRKPEAGKPPKAKRMGKDARPPVTLSGFAAVAAHGVSHSTAENYRTAVRSFLHFNGGRDPQLSALETDTLRRYERWLHQRGVCPNTSSCYMRALRAIYNKAAAKRLVKDKAPFKGVFTGNEKTVKRGIAAEEIRKIKSLEGTAAADFFLFSFYAMGMPFADMARLKKSQVRDGVLTYRRRKTGKTVRVTLEPCMKEIIARYEEEGTEFVFPILYKKGEDTRERPVSYPRALGRYNRALKQLARRAGIKTNLTSYVARHTWASIAYEQGVGLPLIAKALGHTDTQTTLVYIERIKDEKLAKANRELLKKVRA